MHTVWVQAWDAAGNIATYGFPLIVDGTPPETSITGGPAEGATVAPGPIDFSFGSDESSGFACRLYAVGSAPPAFDSCGQSPTLGVSEPGAYRLEVKAIDRARNEDPTPATRTFTVAKPPVVDRRAPAVSLAGRNGKLRALLEKGAAVTLTADEPGTATVELVLSRALAKRLKLPVVVGRAVRSVGAGSSPVVVKLAAKARRRLARLRSVTLTARASVVDAAGNRGTASRKLRFKR